MLAVLRYLLAAEADRIQDLIFRSSRLREVVGGSQLLTRFCDDVPKLLAVADEQVITSAGGSFRIELESEESARRFGAALAEAYSRATGGTLSIAEPAIIADDSKPAWKKASEDAGENLRQAKRRGPPVATAHMPYIAFCESCGVGLAEAHESWIEGEGDRHYICPSCRAKAAERVTKSLGRFLKPFYSRIVPDEKALSNMGWPHDAEAVGRYDPRGYVAYIVADGDDMGQVFSACDREQARALSQEMDEALKESLSEPIRRFMRNPAANWVSQFIPVLPLILGGDDLFALVPAPWALDIARRLCWNFRKRMTRFVQEEGIKLEQGAEPKNDSEQKEEQDQLVITMTAAVVICKANYPYYLAHEIGEHRLSEAKRMVKALAAQKEIRLSAVDFEVVLGSQAAPKEHMGQRRPTLCPYWVTGKEAGDEEPEKDRIWRERIEQTLRQEGWGLPIHALLEQRVGLVGTPARRLSQLRGLFDPASGIIDAELQWDNEMRRLMKRVERDLEPGKTHPMRAALEKRSSRPTGKSRPGTRTRSWIVGRRPEPSPSSERTPRGL